MGLGKDFRKMSSLLADVNTKVVLNIPLDKVLQDPHQVRKTFNDKTLKELSISLVRQGQIEPIVVYPKNSDGFFVIQKGERRFRAAKLAGLTTIEAIINNTSNLAESVVLMQQLAENIQREDLQPFEIAKTLERLKKEGLDNKQMSESLGKSPSWVSQHLNILKAPECVMALIKANKATDATAINDLIKLNEVSPKKCIGYCEEVLSDKGGMVSRGRVKELRVGKGKVKSPVKKTPKAKAVDSVDIIKALDNEVWTVDLENTSKDVLVLLNNHSKKYIRVPINGFTLGKGLPN